MISRGGDFPTLFIATIDTLASESVATNVKVLLLIDLFVVFLHGKLTVTSYETPPKEASWGGF